MALWVMRNYNQMWSRMSIFLRVHIAMVTAVVNEHCRRWQIDIVMSSHHHVFFHYLKDFWIVMRSDLWYGFWWDACLVLALSIALIFHIPSICIYLCCDRRINLKIDLISNPNSEMSYDPCFRLWFLFTTSDVMPFLT